MDPLSCEKRQRLLFRTSLRILLVLFGLTNSETSFTRLMCHILRGCISKVNRETCDSSGRNFQESKRRQFKTQSEEVLLCEADSWVPRSRSYTWWGAAKPWEGVCCSWISCSQKPEGIKNFHWVSKLLPKLVQMPLTSWSAPWFLLQFWRTLLLNKNFCMKFLYILCWCKLNRNGLYSCSKAEW